MFDFEEKLKALETAKKAEEIESIVSEISTQFTAIYGKEISHKDVIRLMYYANAYHKASQYTGGISIPVLGLTRSGKSTLINSALGCEVRKPAPGQQNIEFENPIATVGDTLLSSTIYAECHSAPQQSDYCYIDTAGFLDTRDQVSKGISDYFGDRKFITNLSTLSLEICINNVMRHNPENGMPALIVVVNYKELTGGASQSLAFVKILHSLLGCNEALSDRLIFVVTHADDRRDALNSRYKKLVKAGDTELKKQRKDVWIHSSIIGEIKGKYEETINAMRESGEYLSALKNKLVNKIDGNLSSDIRREASYSDSPQEKGLTLEEMTWFISLLENTSKFEQIVIADFNEGNDTKEAVEAIIGRISAQYGSSIGLDWFNFKSIYDWGKGESCLIQPIESANYFSVMKKDGQLAEILGSLTQLEYRVKLEKLANVLRQYYEKKTEENINFFHEGNSTESLKEYYVVPKLKVIRENEYGYDKKDDSAVTVFSPEDLLIPRVQEESKEDHTLIKAALGLGKTKLCQQLALKWAEKIGRDEKIFSLLIWLPLKKIHSCMKRAKKDFPIEDFSIGAYLYHYCGCKEDFDKEGLDVADIDEILEQAKGETLYVLDTYDKIADAIEDSAGKPIFKNFLEQLLKNPYVVMTSRLYFSEKLSSITPKTRRNLELLGFGPEEARGYIEKYFAAKPSAGGKINSLLRYIDGHPELTKWLSNPMLLQALCGLWEGIYSHQGLGTEITRGDLYSRVIEILLKKIDKEAPKERKDLTKRVLGKLAFSKLKYPNFPITEEYIESICKETSKDAWDILFRNVLQSCFLNPIYVTYEYMPICVTYEFKHLGFQEFYAASHVAKEFVKTRENGNIFDLMNFLGEGENIYDAKYDEMWPFVFSLLIKEGAQIAIDFFELLNKRNVLHSIGRLANKSSVHPDSQFIFTFMNGSINKSIHLPVLKMQMKEAILLMLSLEQILQMKEFSQEKGLFAEKKEQYLEVAKKRVFSIIQNYILAFTANEDKTDTKLELQYGLNIKLLRQRFIKTIALSPRLLKEKLLQEIPQADTIFDVYMRAHVLTFYCDLHLLGDSFSDDISSKINKNICDNFEYIYRISLDSWYGRSVVIALGLYSGLPEPATKMKFDARKLLSHDLIDKLIGYYLLDIKNLRKKVYSLTRNLPYNLSDRYFIDCFSDVDDVPPFARLDQYGWKRWKADNVRDGSFRILYNQYLLNPQHLLDLIEKYGRDNATQPEEKEKLKELKEAIIKTASRAPQKENYSGENGSARLSHSEEKISQHSFWCCRVSSPMVLPDRDDEAPSFPSKKTSGVPNLNLTSEPSPRIKEVDPKGQSIVNQKSKQNILSQSKMTFFNDIEKEISTKGGGDCAFHAILGEEHNGIIEYQNIAAARKKLCDAIIKPINVDEKVRADFITATIAGIQNWVMSGRCNAALFSNSYQLAQDYDRFKEEKASLSQWVWESFESEIKKHSEITHYIKNNHSLKEEASFKDKFYSALLDQKGEGEDELYNLIFSIPELQQIFDEYNRKMDEGYDWPKKINEEYPAVKEEFATFVGTPHVWLAAAELLLIAYAFGKTVHYFPYRDAELIKLNEGANDTPVLVQFNGENHFERIIPSMSGTHTIASSRRPSR